MVSGYSEEGTTGRRDRIHENRRSRQRGRVCERGCKLASVSFRSFPPLGGAERSVAESVAEERWQRQKSANVASWKPGLEYYPRCAIEHRQFPRGLRRNEYKVDIASRSSLPSVFSESSRENAVTRCPREPPSRPPLRSG